MRHLKFVIALGLALQTTAAPDLVRADTSYDVEMGNRLASVLRAGRSVVSNNQALINDPDVADKGLNGEAFYAMVVESYLEKYGQHPLSDDLEPEQRALTETQLNAMVGVINENQDIINADGLAFKGFIPAVFARLVNEKFGDEMGTRAAVKVTAPKELVRNRKARPDDWENQVINDRFRDADWAVGEAFYETTTVGGKEAFRMLIPEYYSESCLACHGSPAGETDVTGFPKEGGELGELAGAISITLYK
ncbi:Tll0287-like domain-containing protein [Roseobacter ponti]|nr:DUF3365 domain-containing protein [Roseobacter ponti]